MPQALDHTQSPSKATLSKIMVILEDVAWYDGHRLVGLSFRDKQTHWLMVTTVLIDDTKYVCYIESRSISGCIDAFLGRLRSKSFAHLRWHRSKY